MVKDKTKEEALESLSEAISLILEDLRGRTPCATRRNIG